MTVTWHVDDLKISHKESDEVTKFITELGKRYGNDLTVHRGKVHSYLGMHFYYGTKGTVKISMIPYTTQIIDDFPEPVTSTAPIMVYLDRPYCFTRNFELIWRR